MDKEVITKRLKELASDSKQLSKTAKLRKIITDVEDALTAGVSRTAVLEELNKHGFDMSFATFATTLKRIRKKIREKSLSTSVKSAKQTHSKTSPEPKEQPLEIVDGSHNPADLNAIIGDTPDLAALAKIGKGKKKNDS